MVVSIGLYTISSVTSGTELLQCPGSDMNLFESQLFDARFAQRLTKPYQVGRVTRQTRLEIVLAAEVLEIHALCPALADRLVAFVVCVFKYSVCLAEVREAPPGLAMQLVGG